MHSRYLEQMSALGSPESRQKNNYEEVKVELDAARIQSKMQTKTPASQLLKSARSVLIDSDQMEHNNSEMAKMLYSMQRQGSKLDEKDSKLRTKGLPRQTSRTPSPTREPAQAAAASGRPSLHKGGSSKASKVSLRQPKMATPA